MRQLRRVQRTDELTWPANDETLLVGSIRRFGNNMEVDMVDNLE